MITPMEIHNMGRLFGLLMNAEKEATYKDDNGFKIIIQASKTGWTVIWADGGTSFEDKCVSTEENFNNAYRYVTNKIGNLTEVVSECYGEC